MRPANPTTVEWGPIYAKPHLAPHIENTRRGHHRVASSSSSSSCSRSTAQLRPHASSVRQPPPPGMASLSPSSSSYHTAATASPRPARDGTATVSSPPELASSVYRFAHELPHEIEQHIRIYLEEMMCIAPFPPPAPPPPPRCSLRYCSCRLSPPLTLPPSPLVETRMPSTSCTVSSLPADRDDAGRPTRPSSRRPATSTYWPRSPSAPTTRTAPPTARRCPSAPRPSSTSATCSPPSAP